jgi:hypothetical protein
MLLVSSLMLSSSYHHIITSSHHIIIIIIFFISLILAETEQFSMGYPPTYHRQLPASCRSLAAARALEQISEETEPGDWWDGPEIALSIGNMMTN